MQRRAAAGAVNAVERALPSLIDQFKKDVKEEAVELACNNPPIGIVGGADAYAGPGATVQGGPTIDPKSGQLSLFLSLGVGAGYSTKLGPPEPVAYGNLLLNAPSGLSLNGVSSLSWGYLRSNFAYSNSFAGPNEGDQSLAVSRVVAGFSAKTNVAVEGSVPLTPYVYDMGCDEES